MSVSHELRTPLTAIRGHVAALREGVVEDPETIEQSLETVAEEAERLGRLVGDVLDLAKLDAHRFTVLSEEVDMGRLMERAYSTFSDEARRRRIDYTTEADEAPVIISDGDRVLQIISNLLSNAFRWTPDGGRIDLSLESRNGSVVVDVADTGPGIPREAQERIFRPFWSTDGRGTGLGLRSRASSRSRSAAGSSCAATSAKAAASGWCCRTARASARPSRAARRARRRSAVRRRWRARPAPAGR
jgi:two-component system phosphate regulon sensor histidine kinase PhoR